MAVTGEGRVYEALLGLLKQWPSGGIPIVYSNIQYPPNGQNKADRYIVVSWSPGTPEVITIKASDSNRHSGIFGLSVMTMLNTGEMESQEIGPAMVFQIIRLIRTD